MVWRIGLSEGSEPAAALAARIALLPRGSGFISRQYRPTDHITDHLIRLLPVLCRARGVIFLAAQESLRPRGRLWHIGGAHYPPRALRLGQRLARPKPDWLITASAHNWRELRRAEKAGADMILLSPFFPPFSKKPFAPKHAAILAGARFAALAGATRLPVLALGGMTQARFRRAKAGGAAGFAGIGWTMSWGAANPFRRQRA